MHRCVQTPERESLMSRNLREILLVLLLLISVGWSIGTAFWSEAIPPLHGVERLQLQSSTLPGETRQLSVHLPVSYDTRSAARYPVLYVLDGQSQAAHTADSAALLARIGVMPEIIVVGVDNGGSAARARDYTPPFMQQDLDDAALGAGQGERFLAFLQQEVLPHVERQYRTSQCRMLSGYSRGGLWVMWSLLAAPDLFAARFAHSPALWRENAIINGKLLQQLRAADPRNGFVYLSMGDAESEKMQRAFEQLTGQLPATDVSGWQADWMPRATHQNNAQMATPVGLTAFYRRGAAVDAESCPARLENATAATGISEPAISEPAISGKAAPEKNRTANLPGNSGAVGKAVSG